MVAEAETVSLEHLAQRAEVRMETPVAHGTYVLVREFRVGEEAAAPEALAWIEGTKVAVSVTEEVTGVSAFNSTFRVPRYTMEAEAVVGLITE